MLLPYVLQAGTENESHAAPARRPDHLTPELQEVRMFTALVEALRKLEAAPPGAEPWRYWAAWKIVTGAARAVMELARWTDADWRRIFERKIDHWRRPARGPRPEAETFKEWLEVER